MRKNDMPAPIREDIISAFWDFNVGFDIMHKRPHPMMLWIHRLLPRQRGWTVNAMLGCLGMDTTWDRDTHPNISFRWTDR